MKKQPPKQNETDHRHFSSHCLSRPFTSPQTLLAIQKAIHATHKTRIQYYTPKTNKR